MSATIRRARTLVAVCLTALLTPLALTAVGTSASADVDSPTAFLNPGETVTVEFDFRADGQQYEWVVPDGVTEITVELAAGSGANPPGTEPGSTGGAGGHVYARVDVTPLSTLTVLVGGQGVYGRGPVVGGSSSQADQMLGGGASAIAAETQLLAVAGGGGAGFFCGSTSNEVCGSGGAGGYSETAGGPSALGAEETSPYADLVGGTGATANGPGVSRGAFSIVLSDREGTLVVDTRIQVREPQQPDGTAAGVDNGVIAVGPGALGITNRDGGGGSGYYGGGHGGSIAAQVQDTASNVEHTTYTGGGGGGSGYLIDGAEVLELRDNVGNGFAAITYEVPEPVVVDGPNPTLTLGAPSVQAGASFTLAGSGFDPERDYPVILNSDPVLLGTVTTDAEGAFAMTLTIPATVPAGEHVITVGDASIPITVTAAAVPLVADSGPAPAAAASAAPTLPVMGADPLVTGVLAALAATLVVAGAATVRASRQPSPARRAATPTR